jgi:hypothetical protein
MQSSKSNKMKLGEKRDWKRKCTQHNASPLSHAWQSCDGSSAWDNFDTELASLMMTEYVSPSGQASRGGSTVCWQVWTKHGASRGNMAKLISVYSAYNCTMLRRQAEQDVHKQTRALIEALVQGVSACQHCAVAVSSECHQHRSMPKYQTPSHPH